MKHLLSSASKASKLALGLAGCAAATAIAFAAVTFDFSTGVGFVGKGDLQTAWGWNDAKLQASAAGISFYYHAESNSEYEAVCTWTTGEGTRGEKVHNVSHSVSTVSAVNATVASDTRKNGQGKVTGFTLNGFGASSTISSGAVPVVGGPCMGNPGTGGVWTSVTLLSSSQEEGGLYAVSADALEGQSPLLIWSPSPAPEAL